MGLERFMLPITKEMRDWLEKERKRRGLPSVPETARAILSDQFAIAEQERSGRQR